MTEFPHTKTFIEQIGGSQTSLHISRPGGWLSPHASKHLGVYSCLLYHSLFHASSSFCKLVEKFSDGICHGLILEYSPPIKNTRAEGMPLQPVISDIKFQWDLGNYTRQVLDRCVKIISAQ